MAMFIVPSLIVCFNRALVVPRETGAWRGGLENEIGCFNRALVVPRETGGGGVFVTYRAELFQ